MSYSQIIIITNSDEKIPTTDIRVKTQTINDVITNKKSKDIKISIKYCDDKIYISPRDGDIDLTYPTNLPEKLDNTLLDKKERNICVGAFGVVTNNKREILIIERKNGMRYIPGGSLDKGEDIYTAAYREIKEETNLDIGSNRVPINSHAYEAIVVNKDKQTTNRSLMFILMYNNINIDGQTLKAHECKNVFWIKPYTFYKNMLNDQNYSRESMIEILRRWSIPQLQMNLFSINEMFKIYYDLHKNLCLTRYNEYVGFDLLLIDRLDTINPNTRAANFINDVFKDFTSDYEILRK